MRYFLLSCLVTAIMIISWAGFRGSVSQQPPLEIFPDMDRQAKVKAQRPSLFFADGVGSRKPVEGTMPIGYEVPDKPVADTAVDWEGFGGGLAYGETGMMGDYFGDGLPEGLEVSEVFLKRGAERYAINCAICHGAAGNGKGITHSYGILSAANFTDPSFAGKTSATYRPDGSIFHTITHGKGLMGPYGANITLGDRWAIVAYIRAIQMASAPTSNL